MSQDYIAIIHRIGTEKYGEKDVDGAWVTLKSGFLRNKFMSWRKLKEFVKTEQENTKGGE